MIYRHRIYYYIVLVFIRCTGYNFYLSFIYGFVQHYNIIIYAVTGRDKYSCHFFFFFYHLIRPEHGVPDMETSNYAAANTLLYCVQSIGCLWEGGYFHIIRNTLS